jgi:hypothetical protein
LIQGTPVGQCTTLIAQPLLQGGRAAFVEADMKDGVGHEIRSPSKVDKGARVFVARARAISP